MFCISLHCFIGGFRWGYFHHLQLRAQFFEWLIRLAIVDEDRAYIEAFDVFAYKEDTFEDGGLGIVTGGMELQIAAGHVEGADNGVTNGDLGCTVCGDEGFEEIAGA